jgi:hypothetical protein
MGLLLSGNEELDTIPLSSANFVGCVVGFLTVCSACGASSLPPRYPLKAKWYDMDIAQKANAKEN